MASQQQDMQYKPAEPMDARQGVPSDAQLEVRLGP